VIFDAFAGSRDRETLSIHGSEGPWMLFDRGERLSGEA
jgi:hypothetical protein